MNAKIAEKNFWLWGTWGKRVIKTPFLTQKVSGKIRDVIIGNTFIIALNEDGHLQSWGEDKVGCLGLGTDYVTCTEPRKIPFPSDSTNDKVIDIQYGKHHVLALTNVGKVYSWGENSNGQLGHNDTQVRFEPVFVEELRPFTVTQILAVDSMSYALTNHGTIYAWGLNKEGCLALEHDQPRVLKPEPMIRPKDTFVKKLAVKDCGGAGPHPGKTVIAFVELAEPLKPEDQIGGYKASLGSPEQSDSKNEGVLTEGVEADIFQGVDLMRRVMDNTQDWWTHMLDVRHGAPYEDNPQQTDELTDRQAKGDNCTALQLDTFVSLDILERASYELDMLIASAKAQLLEIRSKKGTKNVRFMLTMFMDDCKLRKEKIRRTVAARQLMDHKKAIKQIEMNPNDFSARNYVEQAKNIEGASQMLTRTLQRVRNLKTYDVFTRALQDSLAECLECKLQVHETQIELLKEKDRSGSSPGGDPVLPGLRTIKERWGALKHFSIYNLFQECNLRGQNVTFESDDEMLAFLVQSSDAKIDQIINVGYDKAMQDQLVPQLCYDLLMENAELRKMCNTYQLKVLLMRSGKDKPGPQHGTPAIAG